MSTETTTKSDSNLKCKERSFVTKKVIYLTAFVTVCLTGLGHVPPNPWGGFYCDDASIRVRRNIDTMSTIALFVLLLLPTIVVMYMTEGMLSKDPETTSKAKSDMSTNGKTKSDISSNGVVTSRSPSPSRREEGPWRRAKRVYGKYIVGLLLTTCFNEVTKVLVAEPRPHFFETCNPDMTTGVCAAQKSFVYYSDVSCQAADTSGYGVPRKVTDSMKSFPSGHAQLSAYSAVFMMIYLQSNPALTSSRSGSALKILSLMFFVSFALAASVTRVLDRRHHWWDVLAGDVLGIATAILMKIFSGSKNEAKSES